MTTPDFYGDNDRDGITHHDPVAEAEAREADAVERAMRAMYASLGTVFDEDTGEQMDFEDFRSFGGVISDENTYSFDYDALRMLATAALGAQEAPLEGDEPLATDAMIVERLSALEAQVHRLRTFAEEMAWYAPEYDWEDAARRLLRFGDVRSIPEIYEAARGGEG
jgi:hypothetical protein